MKAIAKRAAMLPIILFKHIGGAVRAHLVYLTIAFVFGSCWIIAWSRSIDPAARRFVFPALRKEDLARCMKERSGRPTAMSTPKVSSDVASVPTENDE
jgi:hypothetical protein